MTKRPTTDAPAATEWKVEYLRLSAFSRTSTDRFPTWQDLTGNTPEAKQEFPSQGRASETGPWEEGVLVVDRALDRFDCRYLPNPTDAMASAGVPSVGDYPGPIAPFDTLARKVLRKAPPLARLAFGGALLKPVESWGIGFGFLRRFVLLKEDIEPGSTRDLVYRINRRRSAKAISGLDINRLCTWSTIQVRNMTVQVSDAGMSMAQERAAGLAVRLELDINSDPAFGRALRKSALPRLWSEFLALGEEIAEKGDIP